MHREREFVAPRDVLGHDVLILDPGRFEGFSGSGHESIDDFGVPASVDNRDAEVGAWGCG